MQTPKKIGVRRFHEMLPGDVFRATIHDIRPGEVTIKFSGGELYTARSMVLPDARIGEDSLFSVQENDFEGRIVLKMMPLPAETQQNNMLTGALANAGLSSTPEMLELGRSIIDAGIPVDSDTLHKAAFFSHAVKEVMANIEAVPGAIPAEMNLKEIGIAPGRSSGGAVADPSFHIVAFLLKENMPVCAESVQTVMRILLNPRFLTEEPLEFFDPTIRDPLVRNPLPNYFRRLYSQIGSNAARRDNLLFMARLKRHKYFQIPYVVEDSPPLLAEFHSNAPRISTAVLAVETNSLGRVEILIHKDSCTLEFRASNDETLNRLKQTAPKLTSALSQKGVSMIAANFKPIQIPFTIMTPLPDTQTAPPPQRYTFDMRV